ncbi:hypothetical protein ACFVMC_15585 [Nocardia sp. NPDC127579]|uniref:hypothetical protein n=1 Tax=Nocardia sp. NPDC127579 TaxID=3345402 RepID=UPI003625D3A8
MTDNPHEISSIVRRVTSGHESLVADLSKILDVEAGLREILLPVRHDSYVTDLRSSLDIEAGLAEVLSARPLPARSDRSAATGSPRGPGTSQHVTEGSTPGRRVSPPKPGAVPVRRADEDDDPDLSRGIDPADPHRPGLQRFHSWHSVDSDLRWWTRKLIYRELQDAREAATYLCDKIIIEISDPEFGSPPALHRESALFEFDRLHRIPKALRRASGIQHRIVEEIPADHADNMSPITNMLTYLDDLASYADHVARLAGQLRKMMESACDDHDSIACSFSTPRIIALRSHVSFSVKEMTNQTIRVCRVFNDFTEANLADLEIGTEELDGVRWSLHTRWPPHRRMEIERDSVLVDHGIYEVRKGLCQRVFA